MTKYSNEFMHWTEKAWLKKTSAKFSLPVMLVLCANRETDHMEASASFRFLALSEEQVEELILLVPSVEVGEHHETSKKVATIKLIDSSLVVIIDEFRRKHSFSPVECDVFVSIASEKRDEVWRAPKAVNYIINIVNCPIVFSYTC